MREGLVEEGDPTQLWTKPTHHEISPTHEDRWFEVGGRLLHRWHFLWCFDTGSLGTGVTTPGWGL